MELRREMMRSEPCFGLHQGEIDLVPKAYPTGDWNYIEAIDNTIAELSPSMLDRCPFMKYLLLERGKLNPQAKSAFMMVGLTIYGNVRRGGADPAQAQANLSQKEFWQGLFHLFGSGQIMGDYGASLNNLLLKMQKRCNSKPAKDARQASCAALSGALIAGFGCSLAKLAQA
jgi:hypothetical protein